MQPTSGNQMPKRSSLGMIALWYLIGEPMHVYRMQKLIDAQGKHRVVNVRSLASLYQTMKRLEHHGLVEVTETVRTNSQPDRSVYSITDSGRRAAHDWLQDMLLETGGEYPEFIAAVSVLFGLAPEEARDLLEERADRVASDLAQAENELAANPRLPRLFLLEEEYRRAVLQAELAWLRSVAADLRGGRLSWDEGWIREMGAKFNPTNDDK